MTAEIWKKKKIHLQMKDIVNSFILSISMTYTKRQRERENAIGFAKKEKRLPKILKNDESIISFMANLRTTITEHKKIQYL